MITVRRVLAPNPGPFTLEGTNTWIVGERPSMVIDPGPDDPGHRRAILDRARDVAAILLTHHHEDHAPGAAPLAEATGAAVYAHTPGPGERPLHDQEPVEAGPVRLVAVHTPGHTSDHLCFLLSNAGRAVFAGDTVLGRGTSVVDPPDGNMAAYLRSLRRLRELDPTTIYPGHGPTVLTPMGRLDYYLRHREEREDQVLRAMAQGKRTPSEMVPGIYGAEVPREMYPVAARSVLAHLIKLEREGRVTRTGRAKDERFVLVGDRPCDRCGRPARPGSRFCGRCGLATLQEGPPPRPAGQ